MDLSDGLSIDLARMCQASGTSAEIQQVPQFPGTTREQALHGGEDYELLFTVRPPVRVPAAFRGIPLSRIGTMLKGPEAAVLMNGEPLAAVGARSLSNMTTSLPDPAPVNRLIEAFRWSKTMFTAASLGIYDLLPATAGSLAQNLHLNHDALERLLDGNVGLGLLEKRGEAYYNQPVAEVYLRKDSPHSLIGYVLYSDRALYPMWGHLDDAVREGTHRWQQTFGTPGPIFDHFFSTEENMRTFVMGMHGFGVLSSPEVVRAFDLSRFHRLVDLGGATGHLTVAACEAYPVLQGVVLDMERVIPVAREIVALSPAEDRITCVAGDFFQGELPEADIYALGRDPARLERTENRVIAAAYLQPVADRRRTAHRRAPSWTRTRADLSTR